MRDLVNISACKFWMIYKARIRYIGNERRSVNGNIVLPLFIYIIIYPALFSSEGPKVDYIVLSPILSSRQLCELGRAESTWLTQGHQQASTTEWGSKPVVSQIVIQHSNHQTTLTLIYYYSDET